MQTETALRAIRSLLLLDPPLCLQLGAGPCIPLPRCSASARSAVPAACARADSATRQSRRQGQSACQRQACASCGGSASAGAATAWPAIRGGCTRFRLASARLWSIRDRACCGAAGQVAAGGNGGDSGGDCRLRNAGGCRGTRAARCAGAGRGPAAAPDEQPSFMCFHVDLADMLAHMLQAGMMATILPCPTCGQS